MIPVNNGIIVCIKTILRYTHATILYERIVWPANCIVWPANCIVWPAPRGTMNKSVCGARMSSRDTPPHEIVCKSYGSKPPYSGESVGLG